MNFAAVLTKSVPPLTGTLVSDIESPVSGALQAKSPVSNISQQQKNPKLDLRLEEIDNALSNLSLKKTKAMSLSYEKESLLPSLCSNEASERCRKSALKLNKNRKKSS